jgi:hypothetical protein
LKKLLFIIILILSIKINSKEVIPEKNINYDAAETIYYAGKSELYEESIYREPASFSKKMFEDKFSRMSNIFIEQ